MFDTILWASDGSLRGDDAVSPVRELCELYGSALRIVHVARPGSLQETERPIDKLKAQATALRRQGINASLYVIRGASGPPGHTILQTVWAVSPDLVVLGGQQDRPGSRPAPDSVTQQLVAAGICPVFVVCGSARASARARAERGIVTRPAIVPA